MKLSIAPVHPGEGAATTAVGLSGAPGVGGVGVPLYIRADAAPQQTYTGGYQDRFRVKLVEIPDSRTTSSTATYILADYPLRINLQPGAEVK